MKHLHSVQMKKTKQYIFSSEEDGEMRVYYLHAKGAWMGVCSRYDFTRPTDIEMLVTLESWGFNKLTAVC
jgi:hypothetical protein